MQEYLIAFQISQFHLLNPRFQWKCISHLSDFPKESSAKMHLDEQENLGLIMMTYLVLFKELCAKIHLGTQETIDIIIPISLFFKEAKAEVYFGALENMGIIVIPI